MPNSRNFSCKLCRCSPIVAAVREELEGEVDPPYRIRETAAGRHVAVTVEPHVQNAWEVLAVYQRLGQIRGVEFVF